MPQSTIVFLSGLAVLGLLFWYLASDVENRKRKIGSLLIACIIALCVWALVPQNGKNPLNLGIDLAGGSAFNVKVAAKVEEDGKAIPVDPRAVEQAINTLRARIDPKGTKDVVLTPQGEDHIFIQIPGTMTDKEADDFRELIKKTAALELRAVHPQSDILVPQVRAGDKRVPGYKIYENIQTNEETGETTTEYLLLSKRSQVKGKHVKSAWPDTQQSDKINVVLTSAGSNQMIRLTKNMEKGRDRLAIVLDGVVKSAPVVNDTLAQQFVITGIDGDKEREDLCAALLNPLENAVEIDEERTISALLGEATVKQGIYAGIAGLALTLVFVLIYYRVAGLVALIGLSVNILMLFGAMAMFDFTFTLPGIAGIILTIGVAVDANVLIYERLREELKEGKSVKAAINAAYEKAFSAIFDANTTTLITALILFWKASGTVKGFAITLTIGILASMFAALVATRVLFWWGTGSNLLKKLNFFNIIPEKAFDFLGKRKIAFVLSCIFLIGGLGIMGVKNEKALGIDFVGGALVTFPLGEADLSSAEVEAVLSGLSLEKLPRPQVQQIPGSGGLLTIECAQNDAQTIIDKLRQDIPLLAEKIEVPVEAPAQPDEGGDGGTAEAGADATPATESVYKISSSRDTVGATLGGEFLKNSLIALALGLVGILIYITIRFEFSFAIGAFAALFHDIIISIGFVVLMGHEITLIHVGAFLTIAGYSINDTIVVFDRIRETLRLKRGDVAEVMNLAINATLSRTILTSLTTFAAVLVLYIFGGPPLKAFSFAIMIGVVVGTYSSIFVASPIVLMWSRMRGSNLRRELLDANLEAQVNPARS